MRVEEVVQQYRSDSLMRKNQMTAHQRKNGKSKDPEQFRQYMLDEISKMSSEECDRLLELAKRVGLTNG